ncbi:MAG: hypothetical protein V1744_05530 [Candidatus Altiarchaeota archaeon]
MGTQISIKLSDSMFSSARVYAKVHGFDNLQDFIRDLLRERLFKREVDVFGGFSTYGASEKSLARSWLTPEEDEAWAHLQKGT